MDVFPQKGQSKEDITAHIFAIASSVKVLLARTGPVMQPELLVAATQILWRLFSRSREISGDFRLLLDDVGPIICDTFSTLVSLMSPSVLRPMDEWSNIVGSVEGQLSTWILSTAKKFAESMSAYQQPSDEPVWDARRLEGE